MDRKSSEVYDFFLLRARRIPPVCLRWAIAMMMVNEDQGLVDAVAGHELTCAQVWQMQEDNGPTETKFVCRVLGCVAACHMFIRSEDEGETFEADVTHEVGEPSFNFCVRPAQSKPES